MLNAQRHTQAAGWAKGQLPVAMQQKMKDENNMKQTSNSHYGTGIQNRQTSQNQRRAAAGAPFGMPSSQGAN